MTSLHWPASPPRPDSKTTVGCPMAIGPTQRMCIVRPPPMSRSARRSDEVDGSGDAARGGRERRRGCGRRQSSVEPSSRRRPADAAGREHRHEHDRTGDQVMWSSHRSDLHATVERPVASSVARRRGSPSRLAPKASRCWHRWTPSEPVVSFGACRAFGWRTNEQEGPVRMPIDGCGRDRGSPGRWRSAWRPCRSRSRSAGCSTSARLPPPRGSDRAGFPLGSFSKELDDPSAGRVRIVWTFAADGRWTEIQLARDGQRARPSRSAARSPPTISTLAIDVTYPPNVGREPARLAARWRPAVDVPVVVRQPGRQGLVRRLSTRGRGAVPTLTAAGSSSSTTTPGSARPHGGSSNRRAGPWSARRPTARRPWPRPTRLRPDLVLLDIGLPDLDGFAVAERLAGAALPDVVLISSRDRAAYADRIASSPAVGYIAKADLDGDGAARACLAPRAADGE